MNQNNKTLIILAYFSAFLGVCGHASSEFFVKLSGISGVEVSVWRFGLGGFALLILCRRSTSWWMRSRYRLGLK